MRDVALALMTIGLWLLEVQAGEPAPMALSVAAGAMTVVSGFLLHEWGHLCGALLAHSHVHYPNRLWAPLLFHFAVERNDRRQFLWMSYGGYIASLIGLFLIVALVPTHRLSGQVALGLTSLGVAVTFVAELPTTVRVLRGGALPSGYAFNPPPGGESESA